MGHTKTFFRLGLSCVVAFMTAVVCAAEDHTVFPVSMVELLANPAAHKGDRVSVDGYLKHSSVGMMLFLTKDNAMINDTSSGLRTRDDLGGALIGQSACVNHYVNVTATVAKARYTWELSRVERVVDLDDIKECWKNK